MNDTALIEALRERFTIDEAEREYLDSYYNDEIEADNGGNFDDTMQAGIELGNIETKAELLAFLDSLEQIK
jgi:hypothetical protein